MKNIFLITLMIPSLIWASEELPGGTGTTSDFSVQAFSHPLGGTRGPDRRQFTVGNSFFNKVWVSGPASTTARDGLGPIYNAVACSACHFKDGRGRGLPEEEGKVDVSLLFRLRVKALNSSVIPHPNYGEQFQPHGVEGVAGEGEAQVKYQKIKLTYSDGFTAEILKPIYEFVKLNFGDLGETTIKSPRVAPQMVGLGLLENIDAAEILKREDPYDLDGDGISGRANFVRSALDGEMKLGRFGWKAGKPSLLEQNAAAFNGDMGITSYLFPHEECTSVEVDCLNNQSSDDITKERLDSVTIYTQLLAVPARRDFNKIEVTRGKSTMQTIGCTSCHTASYTTSSHSSLSVLNDQEIYPYTDMLLHDMGDALADDKEEYFNEGLASTREWRTPPLWGLGLVQTVNGHTRYLHDGRARNLEEAILWHGGEAQKSRDAFINLSQAEREDLIEFLKSL